MPNWLGDLVMALPALAGVAEVFPSARRVAVVRAGLAPLLGGAVDSCVNLPASTPAGLRAAAAELGREEAELGILFTDSFSSALLFRMAGVRRMVGFRAEGRAALGVKGMSRPRKAHLREQYALLVDGLGAWRRNLEPRLPDIGAWREAVGGRLREFGLARQPRVILCPGAAFGPAKRWPAERFARVAEILSADGVSVAVSGSASEKPLAADIAGAAGLGEDAVIAGRASLVETAGLLGHADAVVSNDSGALHLAAACGAKTVGLFGSTDPEWTGPPAGMLLRSGAPCSPCFRRTCDIGYECLRAIHVEDVIAACRTALSGGVA
jgi:heptosyltransferase-2